MSAHWYQSFFQGIALDFWRSAMNPEITSAEVDFLASELALEAGAHVLDVPCGNGRHAIPLAERGLRVSGVDLAQEFIAEARAGAARRAASADFLQSDMRVLPSGPFDAAYCFGNSFGYLEEGGQAAFLSAVAAVLKPGGRFVLDTAHVAESLLPNLKSAATYEVGRITMHITNDYDALESVLHTKFEFSRDGGSEVRRGQAHIETAGELGRMLRCAGFRRLAAYASVDRQAYRLGMQRLLMVCERTL